MKRLIVYSRNHMDPSWRRCFIEHFSYQGDIIHPYSDIEEAQISQQLDFAQRYGWKYGIEQSISVKRYLERNPDDYTRFKSLVEEGKIELLGGGEAVIDYNMVCGESVYRNHYYSIKYCQREFGIRPKYADCPDTFGLSAQLPQIFRQFGYDALTQFDRVFGGHKSFWRGLNGTVISLTAAAEAQSAMYGDFFKYTSCQSCHGEGCELCHGSGIDFSYNFSYHEGNDKRKGIDYFVPLTPTTRDYIKQFAASDDTERFIYVTSEETLHMPDYPALLREACEENEIELRYMTFSELIDYLHGADIKVLREGNVPEERIDARAEGNPMATGCYTSRIELKRWNRMLEQLLLTAEKLSVAGLPKDRYPHKKLERLWNMMAFIQFHDCITASHTDASYMEILRYCREVYAGASQIRDEAARALEGRITVHTKEGWEPFVVLNPTSKDWSGTPVTAVVCSPDKFEGVQVCGADGTVLPVVEIKIQDNTLDCRAQLKFLASIPAMGYAVFYWRTAQPSPATAVSDKREIENEYYTVSPDGIFDKRLGRVIINSTGSLVLSGDFGHAWGRERPEDRIIPLNDAQCVSRQGDGWCSLTFDGGYCNPERGVDMLTWKRTVTLYDGVDKVFYHTKIDWAGEDNRMSVVFPLALDNGGSAYYEIPYGILKRPDEIQSTNQLGIEDEWPALNWLAVHDEGKDCSVAVFNKGIPGCRVKDGQIWLSLLRSPTQLLCGYANEGARDHGVHEYEYALSSCAGLPESCDPVAFGLRYNTATPSVPATAKQSELPESYSFLKNTAANINVTAVKRDAQGNIIIRAAECYGQNAAEKLPFAVSQIDPLEESVLAQATDTPHFKGFEIKTLRIE